VDVNTNNLKIPTQLLSFPILLRGAQGMTKRYYTLSNVRMREDQFS
jgi:hypothetical protein